MASNSSTTRKGNAFFFYIAIIFVAACVLGGIFYLLPGFVHPFTTDTADQHYAHATFAGGFFLGAVLGLIIARFARPPAGDGITIP